MKWQHVRLNEVAQIVGGATPNTGNPAFWGGNISWVTPRDLSELNGKKLLVTTPRTLTHEGLRSCAAEVLPPNSVLFSSRAPIGLVAINTIPVATNQGFKSFVPDPQRLDCNFLYHWLRKNRPMLERLGVGATFKEVSKAIVSRVELPLPPLDEQRRIAAILDKAEDLRAKRRAAIALLDQLPQAIFQNMFGDPLSSLSKWPIAELQNVVAPGTIVTYGIVQAGEEFSNGVPYIRTGDIVDGEITIPTLRRTDPQLAAKFLRSRVSSGDIVMSIRATVGTTALVPEFLEGANLTQGTARISPGPSTHRLYLLNFLRTPATQDWLERQVKGATFREITLARLRELPVVLPPLALQRQFAERVECVYALKESVRAGLVECEHLFLGFQETIFGGDH